MNDRVPVHGCHALQGCLVIATFRAFLLYFNLWAWKTVLLAGFDTDRIKLFFDIKSRSGTAYVRQG